MKEVHDYYQTIIRSRSVKYDLFAFETEEDAISFAEENDWEWYDENEFCWSVEIEERHDENGIIFFDNEDFEEEPDDDEYPDSYYDQIEYGYCY